MKLIGIVTNLLLIALLASCSAPKASTNFVTATQTLLPRTISTEHASVEAPPAMTPTAYTSSDSAATEVPPTPYPLFTPSPSKKVLIEFGNYFVEGGSATERELGLNLPELVLYSDGELILAPRWSGMRETVLTPNEMCGFLRQIREAGFYEVNTNNSRKSGDPLYNYPADFQSSNGGNEYRILVNGPTPKSLWIYEPDVEYLVPPAKATLSLLLHYQPPRLRSYNVQQLLLSISPGRNIFSDPLSDERPVVPWPSNLPPLASLSYTGYYLSGHAASSLERYFSGPYDFRFFSDQGLEYTISSRPVLPHETTEIILSRPGGVSELLSYDFPFHCRP